MRINVYSQEIDLHTPPAMIIQNGFDKEGKPAVFIGIRFYLHSSERLHFSDMDDDRSAITFWLPESPPNRMAVGGLFMEAVNLITAQAIASGNPDMADQHGEQHHELGPEPKPVTDQRNTCPRCISSGVGACDDFPKCQVRV